MPARSLSIAAACLLAGISGAKTSQAERGRTPNHEYLAFVRNAMAGVRAADPWNTTGIKGVHYIPSTSHNSIQTWVDYDANLVKQELGFAAAATVNTVRVQLHWVAWAACGGQGPIMPQCAQRFTASLENFIATAHSLGLRVILALFDGTGCCDADPSWVSSGSYKTAGWTSGPGNAMVNNASSWTVLDAYMNGLAKVYGNDPRIVGWDVMYQPVLQLPTEGGSFAFLSHITGVLNALVDPTVAFTTYSIIPGGEMCDSARVPLGNVTVFSFENYNGNLGAIAGDTGGVQGCAASLAKGGAVPPVILSGTMNRQAVPTQGLCDCLFEASGQPWIDIPSHPPVGVIITNLMLGVDGSSYGNPPNMGLVWPNGSWYSEQEKACMMAPVPGPPPAPPGPPAPIVNFTAGGLVVGLRPGTRAIQSLAIEGDDRWFFNFSFVPPLWNFLPPRPHRDFPGSHHIGDLILRVQPGSVTDPASWAMYSTAYGTDTPALPLNSTDQSVFDASDITAPLTAGGQPDTRYSLGLQVQRFFEAAPVPGGATQGFRLRFDITNTNSSAVRVGSLDLPLLTDSNFGGINLTQVAAFGSFLDGYPGGPRSFATLTRADGSDTAIVWPCEPAPGAAPTPMEAWRPVLEDGSNTGGGVYSWEVVSAAYAPEWAANKQFPSVMEFPQGPLFEAAWPNPLSPTPSWHLAETMSVPNPRQWNPPTSWLLQPGETRHVAVCFALAMPPGTKSAKEAAQGLQQQAELAAALTSPVMKRGPRSRDSALARVGEPVLFPVPGYVLGTDMSNASLAVLPPYATSVANISCDDPTVLAVVGRQGILGAGNGTLIRLQGLSRGRARLLVSYTDGSWQAVQYFVLPGMRDHVNTYGVHASNTAWLPRDFQDPFGRSASVMPWDSEDGVHVLQDGRPFVVGLSDDAGASPNLGLASKVAINPTVLQASRLDDYVYWTLLGVKNDTALPPLFSLTDTSNNRIRMTVFYFDNPKLNATNYYTEDDKCQLSPSWCSFNAPFPGYNPANWIAEYRQFNFPHQTSVYYALYRVARDWDGLASQAGLRQSWAWYLYQAALTTITTACPDMQSGSLTCIPSVGLMDGTVFREVLQAVREEAAAGSPSYGPFTWSEWAGNITTMMSVRVYGQGGPSGSGEGGWINADFPYGSEFNFDTTGQEEVAVWGAWFNATSSDPAFGSLASRAVDAILAFDPSQPVWALHGSAWGMGDMSNNAKWMVQGGWEREGGHYRAGLNSIPLMEGYLTSPDDTYVLHVGLGGVTGILPNIQATGAPSMAFHTYPFVMQHDPYSGDWGLAFFGSTMGQGAYLLNHTVLGWTCMMCDAAVQAGATKVTLYPRDAFHTKVFVEPLGLLLKARTGSIYSVSLDFSARSAVITFETPSNSSMAEEVEEAQIRDSERSMVQTQELGAPLFSNYRLQVTGTAPSTRPFSFTLTSPAGATLDRGAYSWPAAAGTGNATATISW